MMTEKHTIVVADNNSHVRELIKRELSLEGYKVYQVKNCKEILNKVNSNRSYDILIIDPDLPDMEGSDLFRKLQNLNSDLPIIIHTYLSDDMNKIPAGLGAEYIEKNASSIDQIKKVVKSKLKTSIV